MAVALAKEGFEKELTCPLCLEIFQDPKILPCHHIYCKEPCLQGLVLRSLNATITCPECRTEVQVPHSDVNRLPTAFQTNRLKELYYTMQDKDERNLSSFDEAQKPTCMDHALQPIALYCETCEKLLCRDCVIKSNEHKEHAYGYVDEVASRQLKAIESELEPAEQLKIELSTALEKVSEVKKYFSFQKQAKLNQIDDFYETIVAGLREEKELLKTQITQKNHEKTTSLVDQEEMLTTHLSDLSNTVEEVKRSIQSPSNENTLLKIKAVKQFKDVCETIRGLSLQPVEKAEDGLCLTSPSEVISVYKKGNYRYPLADPQKCIFEGIEHFETGKPCIASLQIRDFAGKISTYTQNVRVELLCIRSNEVICGEILQSSTTSSQIVSVTSENRGRHEISVRVNNSHIAGSPFPVFIHKPPQQLGRPSCTIIADSDRPVRLLWCKDKFFVLNNSAVSVYNKNRDEKLLTCVFQGITGLAIDTHTEEWFVTDAYQLHKLNKQSQRIKSVGSSGTGPDNFNRPSGVQISKNGEIFVCDARNDRIKVFDKDLHLKRIIGEQVGKKSRFNRPIDIAFDDNNNLYVTEQGNNRVQMINPDGKTILTFGKLGSRPGQLNCPIGIAINGDYVYVVEAVNARVSVFTKQGEFVTAFGSYFLHSPEFIAVDRDGYVYVSDNRERILVF